MSADVLRRRSLAFNALTTGLAGADRFVPLSVRESITDAILAAIDGGPKDATAPARVPCPEGFHWIGQPFTHCDRCGLPAWEHAGTATMRTPDSPFDDSGTWTLKPWEPGEAEACRTKWDPAYVPNGDV